MINYIYRVDFGKSKYRYFEIISRLRCDWEQQAVT